MSVENPALGRVDNPAFEYARDTAWTDPEFTKQRQNRQWTARRLEGDGGPYTIAMLRDALPLALADEPLIHGQQAIAVRVDLRRAHERLAPKQRALLAVLARNEFDYAEVAEALDLTNEAIRMRANRALAALLRIMS